MYIDTYALGEAKADATPLMACGCMLCMGKSGIERGGYALDLPYVQRGAVTTTLAAIAAASPAVAAAAPTTVLAPPASADLRLTGTLASGETGDVYAIDLVAGTTYSFALRGLGADGVDDPLVALFDAEFDVVNFDDDGGAGVTSLLTFTATASGTYYVLASSYSAVIDEDVTSDLGDYALDLWVQRAADQVPDTFAGAVTIAAGTTFGHIETSGDVDTYRVFLEAGRVYTFQLAGGADGTTNPAAVPAGELDTLLALYAPDGTFITLNDDIAFPRDIGSGLAFVPQASGFYYLDVLAYPDQTGGYTLDVTNVGVPADFDPLDAIDWRSSNTIPTTVVGGVETAYVYFGDSDENFGQTGDDGEPMVTIDWNAFEKQQVMLSLEEYTRILGITYVVTDDVDQATFRLLKTESQQYGAYFFPQDPAFGGDQGVGVFNVLSGGWSLPGQASLLEGGYSFAVMLHEFGHAHGLAHPHDNGGGSDVMLGVTSPTGSYGLFNLNQGVYTVMSYNDAWDFHPDGPTPYTRANIDSGWTGTLSTFDIAMLQRKYGAVARETGDTVYRLGDANDAGTFYQTIWDSAGTDEIRYDGARAAQIDLTAATLDYSPTGGGAVSFVDDIWGGYTIANGVVIENAAGGSGADVLLGNAAVNVLTGNGGDDTLAGRGGGDTLDGGAGLDIASYADSATAVTASLAAMRGTAGDAAGDRFIAIEGLAGSAFADTLVGSTRADTLRGAGGDDSLAGGAGDDRLEGGAGIDTADYIDGPQGVTVNLLTGVASGAAGADTLTGIENIRGSRGADTLTGDAAANRIKGETGNDTINGGAGDDQLFGDGGDDTIIAGLGNDAIAGGDGIDTLDFYLAARAATVNLSSEQRQDTGVGLDTINTIENLRGSVQADRLTGSNAANRIKGENGNDFIFGLGGADTLFGDGGDDTINGGAGYDVLAGGAGVDRFVFDSLDGDTISDWTSGEKIDVRAFAGSAVNVVSRSGRATVSFDRDGDGQFDDGFFTVDIGSQAFGTGDLILA